MKPILVKYLVTLSIFIATFSLAQGTIQGTISVNEVSGFSVIACYADAQVGCNESLSSLTQISTSGTSASYSLENLSAGQYLIFLWRDTNGSGELEEDQDEITYYAAGNEEVTLVSPPAQNINFNLDVAAPTASSLATPELLGSWSDYGYLGNYLTGNTTAKLDFLEASQAHSFIFNADSTYSSLTYTLHYDEILNRYIACTWTKINGTYALQGNKIITKVLTEEAADCGFEFKPVSALTRATETFVWRFEQTDKGLGLGILDTAELSTVDETSWISGYAAHLFRDK
jgi:uncharacterized protein (DUF2141 family)